MMSEDESEGCRLSREYLSSPPPSNSCYNSELQCAAEDQHLEEDVATPSVPDLFAFAGETAVLEEYPAELQQGIANYQDHRFTFQSEASDSPNEQEDDHEPQQGLAATASYRADRLWEEDPADNQQGLAAAADYQADRFPSQENPHAPELEIIEEVWTEDSNEFQQEAVTQTGPVNPPMEDFASQQVEEMPCSSPTLAIMAGGRVVWMDDTTTNTVLEDAAETEEDESEQPRFPDWKTKIVSKIIASLYNDALHSDPQAKFRTPLCETCTDFSCQDATWLGYQKRRNSKKDVFLSESLRRGRAAGWSMISLIVFPLLHDLARDMWVTAEIVTSIIVLSLSIAILALGRNEVFNYVHLAVAILSTILALLDGVYTLKNRKSCIWCYRHCKHDRHEPRDREPYFKCCSKKDLAFLRNVTDIARAILCEVLLYPLLVCAIFDVITGMGFENAGGASSSSPSTVGAALLVFSSASFIVHVYVARSLMVARALGRIHEARTPNKSVLTQQQDCRSTSGNIHHIYIMIQMSLLMLTQVFLLVAIGAKIRYENRHFYERGNIDDSVYVSGFLWYMIVAAYIAPSLGFIASLLVMYYWVQQYPIRLCLDVFGVWKQRDSVEHINSILGHHEQIIEQETIERKIERFLKIDDLTAEFRILHKTPWCNKFAYPFQAPVIAVTCIFYLTTVIAFIACTVSTVDEIGNIAIQTLNGGGWSYYVIAASAIWAVANAYTFTVALFWIITCLFSVISAAFSLLCCPCTCFCGMAVLSNLIGSIRNVHE